MGVIVDIDMTGYRRMNFKTAFHPTEGFDANPNLIFSGAMIHRYCDSRQRIFHIVESRNKQLQSLDLHLGTNIVEEENTGLGNDIFGMDARGSQSIFPDSGRNSEIFT